MTVSLETSILNALIYADIFDYPLTIRELTQWMPTARSIPVSTIARLCTKLRKQKRIQYFAPFYVLPRKKALIGTRVERLAQNAAKWKKAYRVARILSSIPTVLLVGVTGGLSMNNAHDEDDIDLFVVTTQKALWITRLLVTILVEIVSQRRRPGAVETKDAICLNMFMTEHALQVPKKEQGWYSAHEVLQMMPLFDRGGMYQKFITSNAWVRNWFRNAYAAKVQKKRLKRKTGNNHIKWYQFCEGPARTLQVWYMQRHRTTEVISDRVIRFHPKDARIWIQQSFTKKRKHFKVPLDKRWNQI